MSSLMADPITMIVGRSGAEVAEGMLIYSMSVSVDGFIADREGAFSWSVPDEEQFRFHVTQTQELGGFLLGPQALRDDAGVGDGSVDARQRAPRRVRRRLVRDPEDRLQPARSTASKATPGSPKRRWPKRPLRHSTRPTRTSRSAALASLRTPIELDLVDELRIFRHPIVVGGGTPFLPPVTEDVPFDLIETRTFGSRVIYERYRRVRDESD